MAHELPIGTRLGIGFGVVVVLFSLTLVAAGFATSHLVDEAAAAALKAQSDQLMDAVGVFRLAS